MKRALLALASVALFVLGCQDSQVGPPDGPPNFAVSDGAHLAGSDYGNVCDPNDPCFHLFFLPPIVPTPDHFNGEFNADLAPTVVITDFGTADPGFPYDVIPFDGLSGTECENPNALHRTVFTLTGGDISVDQINEVYSVGWNTGSAPDTVTSDIVYRICVQSPGRRPDGTFGIVPIGFRDVKPEDTNEDNRATDQAPIYEFKNGSNIPIKFRLEAGVLCDEGLDCGEGIIAGAGDIDPVLAQFAGFQSTGGAEGVFTVIVQELSCSYPQFARLQSLDIPLYPGCYDVTVLNELGQEVALSGVIGVCFDLSLVPPELRSNLQLHHETSQGVVEALPNAPTPWLTEATCSGFQASNPGSNRLVDFAQRTFRTLTAWLTPEAVLASDGGFGGASEEESPVVWGATSLAGPNGATSFQGKVGDTQPVSVLVKMFDDESGLVPVLDATPAECTDPLEVAAGRNGACVTFTTDEKGTVCDADGNNCGPFVEVPTDVNGIAQVQWTWTGGGIAVLTAEGFGLGLAQGIADPNPSSCTVADLSVIPGCYRDFTDILGNNFTPLPPNDFGVFGVHEASFLPDGSTDPTTIVNVGTGVLTFTAEVCDNGLVNVTTDGQIILTGPDAEGYTNSDTLTANVASGGKPATIYWTNDCDNLYLALEIQTDEVDDNGTLRVVFDNDPDNLNGTAGPSADDNVLFLEKGKSGKGKDAVTVWTFTDNFLGPDCINSKQASCASLDAVMHGQGTFRGSPKDPNMGGPPDDSVLPGNQWGVYEISFPLEPLDGTGTPDDWQLSFGDKVAFFIAVQGGQGSKGNTEWKDFREYTDFDIVNPAATP
jgi:hypothetical protein